MRHELLLYDDDDILASRAVPFLEDGLDCGETVMTVMDERKLDLLRDTLGRGADRVTCIACSSHYTRPEAAIADYDATVRSLVRDGAPAVRLLGELPTLRGPEQWDAWIAYDAILNRAFAHHPVSILCGYDSRVLPEELLDGARRAHPCLHGGVPNADYHDPVDVVRAHTPAPQPLPELRPLSGGNGDGAGAVRRALVAEMAAASMPRAAIEEMALAANEVLVNARRHGGGPPEVRVGRVGDQFVCELTDHGRGFDDPLAGHLPPHDGAPGAGLWIARQATTRLEMIPAADGMTVRLWV
jgi:anti-sigma regulatory factor (Ser/Thr protein kinase)